jgi:hypothetical protein
VILAGNWVALRDTTTESHMPDPSEKTDEELVADIPPKDGSAKDPVAQAEAHLDNVDLDADREALKKIQQDLPSAG